MSRRPSTTKVRARGRTIRIRFSQADGEALARHVHAGGSLMDGVVAALGGPPLPTTDADREGTAVRTDNDCDGGANEDDPRHPG